MLNEDFAITLFSLDAGPLSTIRIKSLVSASVVVTLDVAASDTVLSVKRRLCAANARYPVWRQILFNVIGRADEPLDDRATLHDAGVIAAAELMLFLHPVDGAISQYMTAPIHIYTFILILRD